MQSYKKAKRWDYGEVITPQKLNDMSDALQAFTEQIYNATSKISDKYDSEGKSLNEKLNDRLADLESRIQFNSIDAIRDIVSDFTQEAVSYAEDQSGWLDPKQKETARKNIGAAAFADTVSYTNQIPNDPNDTTFSTKQQIARDNIDAVGRSEFNNKVAGVVKYIDQTTDAAINDDMRGVARANIGAIDRTIAEQVAQATVDTAMATVNSKIGNAEYVKYTANQGLNPTQQGNARANIGAIATGDAVTNITSTTGKLYITKGIGTTPTSINISADLAFDGGFCQKEHTEDGDVVKLHLTKKDTQGRDVELDMGVYTPIALQGVGGGLAFDGGKCEAVQVTDPITQEKVTKYYLYLTRGENQVPIEGFTPIELIGGGTGGSGTVGGAGIVLIKKESSHSVIMTGQQATFSVKVKSKDTENEVGIWGKWYVNKKWIRTADKYEKYNSEGSTFSLSTSLREVQQALISNKTDNTIRIELTGQDGSTRAFNWTVATRDFIIAWKDLDPIIVYDDGTHDCILPIEITAPQGNYHFQAVGKYGNSQYSVVSENFDKILYANTVNNLVIPRSYLNNRLGKHLISVKLVQTNDTSVGSPQIKIVVLNEVPSSSGALPSPAVVLLVENTTLQQYDTAIIKYYVFDKEVEIANIRLSLTYNNTSHGLDAILNQTQECETNTVKQFKYPFYSPHPDGAVFKIEYVKNGQTLFDEVTLIINARTDINLSYTSGTVYDFDPRGWTNQATNRTNFGALGNNKIIFNNFDWVNGGFKEDIEVIDGTPINYGTAFVVKKGSSITLPVNLFKDNDTNGKTIDISFRVKNSMNYNAQAFSNVANYTGLKLFANYAELYLHTAQPLTIRYAQQTKIDLSINVDAKSNDSTRPNFGRLATVWLGGVPASTIKYTGGNLVDNSSTLATIGSNECDIYIYGIRTYNSALNLYQMNQNFIADGGDVSEKIKRYDRNESLYSQDGTQLIQNEIIDKRNLTVIHIKAQEMPRDKEHPMPAQVTIYDQGEISLELDDQSTTKFVVQGTSSAAYERSAFNLDIDFRKCKDSKGNPIVYKISENSIPVNYLNIKVNVASSEHANNVCAVDWYNTYQPFHTEAKDNIRGVRDSIEGKPCVVFIENTHPTLGFWAGSQYVPPENVVFYGAGDLCNSKKNKEVFGQYAKDEVPEKVLHPTKACIEVGGNDTIPQQMLMSSNVYNTLIKESAFNIYPLAKDGKGWYNSSSNKKKHYSYEWRMEPQGTSQEITNIENSWLNAMKWVGSLAEGSLIQKRVYKDEQGIQQTEIGDNISVLNDPKSDYIYEFSVNSYTFLKQQDETDSDYNTRINNLKNQFESYFQLNSLLYHFLMIEYFCAVDDVSKNTFYSYDYDSISQTYKWNIKAAYDWDTILGCDNDGKLNIEYGLDYEEEATTGAQFNAKVNPLWNFLRTFYKDELYQMYANLKSSAFNVRNIKNKWNEYQLRRPEAILAFDAYVKYMLPYKTEGVVYGGEDPLGANDSYLARLQGHKRYQRDQFLTYQSYYMDGKYGATTRVGALSFRTYPKGTVSRNFIIVPYTKTYVTIYKDDNTGTVFSKKLIKNPLDLQHEQFISFRSSDSVIYVQPGALIQKLEPLSGLKVRTFDGSSAKKLLNVVLGEDSASESDWRDSKEELSLGSPILQKIDLRNVAGYMKDLDLNEKQGYNIQYLDIRGTGISGVKIVPYSPVKELYFNACNFLEMRNNTQVQTLSFPNTLNPNDNGIVDLYMMDCNQAATSQILPYLILSLRQSLSNNDTRHISINNINWTLQDTDLLHTLYEQKGFNISREGDDNYNSYLAGTVYIHTEANDVDIFSENDKRGKLSSTEYQKFKERWPNLTIIPDYEIKMINVRLRHSSTNEILVEKQMQAGATVTPTLFNTWLTAAGYYPEYSTETKVNVFKNYQDFTSSLTLTDQDITFTVNYEVSDREYEVIWYEDNTQTKMLASVMASYGDDLDYLQVTANRDPTTNEIITLGTLPAPRFTNNTYYLFDGWDNSSGYITESPTIICGKWISSPVTFSRLNDGFSINGQYTPFNKLNAANLYALMRMTPSQREALLGNQSKQLTSVVDITLGHDYNYTSIPSSIWLDEPLQLSGTDSPIKLNDINKLISLEQSFNLLIEFNSTKTTATSTLFSLVDDTRKNTVLSVRKYSNSSDYQQSFQLYFSPNGNNSLNLVSQSTYTNTNISNKANKRFIISNNPSLHKLTIYWWDSGESIQNHAKDPINITWQNWQNKKLTLVLGNQYRTDLYNTWLYDTAKIQFTYIKYWNRLLGPNENKNLALSSIITLPFRYSGYKVHGFLEGTQYTYRTGFSFAQSDYMPFNAYYGNREFLLNYLTNYSTYFEKIFPQSWESIFVPINDYYWSSTLAASKAKSSLKIYPPMYSQSDDHNYYYPEYRDYYIFSEKTNYERLNALVQSTYGIPFDRSILLTSVEDHTVTPEIVNKYHITTGTCVGCYYDNSHRIIFCSAQDFTKLEPTFANKFVPANTARSINNMYIGSGLTDLYVASAYDIYTDLLGGRTSSGKQNFALVYLPTRQFEGYSLYVGYEGGAINSMSDNSNYGAYPYPICCFSIGEIPVTYDENGNEVE